MSWSLNSTVTITGLSVGPIWPEDGRWGCQSNGYGSGEHTFLLKDKRHAQPRVYWRDKFIGRRRTIVQSWDGKAVYAGEITGTSWDPDAGRLTVRSREISGAFDDRLPFGPEHAATDGRAPIGESSFWGLDKRGIARAVLRRGFESDNLQRRLPIDFGPDFPGAEVWSWPWHKFPTIGSMLKAVQSAEGGPDVWFEPKWTPTGLQWVVKLGNPRLSAGTFDYVRGVPDSPVLGFSVSEDALKQSSNVWGQGEGTGRDALTAIKSNVTTPDAPVLDRVEGFSDQGDSAALQALTNGAASSYATPNVVTKFRLRIGPTVDPSLIRPGSVIRVWTPEDEWLEQQRFSGRVVSVEGDMSDVLTVGVM